jgi:histidine racemase
VRTNVPPQSRAMIARALMSDDYGAVEQVGYLQTSLVDGVDGNLEMMGGELCVNALRSAAAWIAAEREGPGTVRLLCSGATEPFVCQVRPIDSCQSYVSLSSRWNIALERLKKNTFLVSLGGISHFVWLNSGTSRQQLQQRFAEFRSRYAKRLAGIPAYGIISVSRRNECLSIDPLVYVVVTDTLVPETACGSGSIAAALVECVMSGSRYTSVLQPSGTTFDLEMRPSSCCWDIHLGSPVTFLFAGDAYINPENEISEQVSP